jgi:hypothetical protein
MQFSPWQFAGTSLPQGITWATAAPGGIQSPATLLTAPNPIFIRGQQDGTGMFIQSPPPQIQSHNRMYLQGRKTAICSENKFIYIA